MKSDDCENGLKLWHKLHSWWVTKVIPEFAWKLMRILCYLIANTSTKIIYSFKLSVWYTCLYPWATSEQIGWWSFFSSIFAQNASLDVNQLLTIRCQHIEPLIKEWRIRRIYYLYSTIYVNSDTILGINFNFFYRILRLPKFPRRRW